MAPGAVFRPFGQWAISGDEIPPSCWFCLYQRNGVLPACAQPTSYVQYDRGSQGMNCRPRVRSKGQAPLSENRRMSVSSSTPRAFKCSTSRPMF